jgi:hypothetical protein
LAIVSLVYALPLVVHLLATSESAQRRLIVATPNTRLIWETGTGVLLFVGIIAARSVATSDFIYFQF